MQKYITRTFEVKTGVKMEPDFTTKTFREMAVTLIDTETVPADTRIDRVDTVKVRMPIEDFFNAGEKILIGSQESISE
jgi:hypothetical protein